MLSFFRRNVLDEILNLIESVSEGFPTYTQCKEHREGSCCLYVYIINVPTVEESGLVLILSVPRA